MRKEQKGVPNRLPAKNKRKKKGVLKMKITGIKKVCGQTKGLYPYCGFYLQVAIKAATGELSSSLHRVNSFTELGNGFFPVADYYRPTPMETIKHDALGAMKIAAWYEKQD